MTTSAIYKRFRPTAFYDQVYAGGTYTADIIGCSWTCEGCWSGFGGKNAAGRPYEPSEVADRLVAGMRRNAQTMARITYGEPAMFWPHIVEVIAGVLEQTQDVRMNVPGLTMLGGDPLGIVIETNGAVGLTPARLDALEERFGADSSRIALSLGIKATTPAQLADLTGQSLKTSERFHRMQMDNLMHAAYNLKRVQLHASFISKFTDPRVYAAIVREVDRARPGGGRTCGVFDFVNYGGTQRLYVPKRMRERSFPDPIPADDEELINKLMVRGRTRPQAQTEDRAEPAVSLEELGAEPLDPEHLINARNFDAALKAQGIPDGKLRPR